MARLFRRQKVVHEIEVAHQRAIDEGGAVDRSAAAADQGAWASFAAAELVRGAPNGLRGLSSQRAHSAPECVQKVELQSIQHRVGQVVEGGRLGERRELLDLGIALHVAGRCTACATALAAVRSGGRSLSTRPFGRA